MKRILTAVLFLLTYTAIHAQSFLSVSSFKSAPEDFTASAVQTRRVSVYGDPCALVKISTRLTGLSFDAGMECIADVVYSDSGVWLFIPAGTRTITIAHAQAGTLRNYHFPVTLESGKTYEMFLKAEVRKLDRPSKAPFSIDGFSTHFLQSRIGMEIYDKRVENVALGVSYSFMPGRLGIYTAVDWNQNCGVSICAGPAVRLLGSAISATDWQLYAAPGISTYGVVGGDFGMRFGWKSGKILSRFDFSIGCQYWNGGTLVPYVGLGASISVYAAGLALTLILLGAGD